MHIIIYELHVSIKSRMLTFINKSHVTKTNYFQVKCFIVN